MAFSHRLRSHHCKCSKVCMPRFHPVGLPTAKCRHLCAWSGAVPSPFLLHFSNNNKCYYVLPNVVIQKVVQLKQLESKLTPALFLFIFLIVQSHMMMMHVHQRMCIWTPKKIITGCTVAPRSSDHLSHGIVDKHYLCTP
jgi:hypothetical protein